jgi:hypothetical protein
LSELRSRNPVTLPSLARNREKKLAPAPMHGSQAKFSIWPASSRISTPA